MLFGSRFHNVVMRIGNSIIRQYDGGSNRPVFLDINNTFPELSLLEQNFDTVKAEFENVNKHLLYLLLLH